MSLAAPLVQEALEGDQHAFMLLVEPLLPAAYRLAVGMLRSESDAEDAVQEAVLKAWRHFGRFRRGSDLRPWLFTIVANECRMFRRQRWWSVVRVAEVLQIRGTRDQFDESATDLKAALLKLSPEERLPLVLHFYLDLPLDEVARTLRLSPAATKSRIYRTARKLRSDLTLEEVF